MSMHARFILSAALVGLVGCGAPSTADTADAGIFLAVASDFTGFPSWSSQTFDTTVASGSSHVAGRRTVYINEMPPPGAAEFPVGTLIVKVTETDGKIFARAKRGGNFNSRARSTGSGSSWRRGARGCRSAGTGGARPPARCTAATPAAPATAATQRPLRTTTCWRLRSP